MAKAYDRMSQHFFTSVLRKCGFAECWIGMILNLISGNWYSIVINGSRRGFFSSRQGLKQGDPLSPHLFIIATEVLSRSPNNFFLDKNFIPFSMPTGGPFINHLTYADDIVIFTSGSRNSLNLIMNCIGNYDASSGQRVNTDKSFFLQILRLQPIGSKKLELIPGLWIKIFLSISQGALYILLGKRMSILIAQE